MKGPVVKKSKVRVTKSYSEGRIRLTVEARAHNIGESVASSISVDIDLDAAQALHHELLLQITKADDKAKAKRQSDERRKKCREREIAAGRMQIITLR